MERFINKVKDWYGNYDTCADRAASVCPVGYPPSTGSSNQGQQADVGRHCICQLYRPNRLLPRWPQNVGRTARDQG